ncbi:hypothetical protein FB106_11911 [Synechococcus sp. Ace-Pa]|nr:hypothetical protein FB106_11911 [Synechococcus sp. Ace-Pa]
MIGMSGVMFNQKIDPNRPPHHRWSGVHRRGLLLATVLAVMTVAGFGTWYAQSTAPPSIAEQTNPSVSEGKSQQVTAYRSASCGCCKGWLDHLRGEGFSVVDHVVENLEEIKVSQGVPGDLASCHTATLAGYVIEGHVPAEAIHQLLRQRPAVAGIAVPGMPLGSPGMESALRSESYTVFSFTRDGSFTPFFHVKA